MSSDVHTATDSTDRLLVSPQDAKLLSGGLKCEALCDIAEGDADDDVVRAPPREAPVTESSLDAQDTNSISSLHKPPKSLSSQVPAVTVRQQIGPNSARSSHQSLVGVCVSISTDASPQDIPRTQSSRNDVPTMKKE